ncbi:MAG: hypothetical protein JWP14_2765 [Frankiales bacterium]|nr:hypothetical protein [Frankiales bacterium]
MMPPAERQHAGGAVCLTGVGWCTRCDLDEQTGDEVHGTRLEPSELLTVDVRQVTNAVHGVEPVEFQIRVHDEPPLTTEQAQQVAREILVAVGSIRPGR